MARLCKCGDKVDYGYFFSFAARSLKHTRKVLPVVRDAVAKQNLPPDDLAILEDRIAIKKGQKQIYGSQVHYDSKTKSYLVYPIEDEVNVNKRRAAVGLQSLEEYLKFYNIKYTPIRDHGR